MFERLVRGVRHAITILRALPVSARRGLLWRMIRFSHALPRQFGQPLPLMMAGLTPTTSADAGHNNNGTQTLNSDEIRRLADAVAAWHFTSPLGICLRRSLLRYHFLWEAGLPVRILFGARLKAGQAGGGIGGHAWLTLDDEPYHENPDDYHGFVVMYRYPADE